MLKLTIEDVNIIQFCLAIEAGRTERQIKNTIDRVKKYRLTEHKDAVNSVLNKIQRGM